MPAGSTDVGARRKAELTQQIVDHILVHGLADLSVRSLATSIGTTDRMLLYYFATRDALLVEVMVAARDRNRGFLQAWIAEGDPRRPPADVLRDVWTVLGSEGMEPWLRLYFEAYGLALRRPDLYAPFLEGTVTEWVGVVRSVLERTDLREPQLTAAATLVLDALRGLLLDLLTTRDRGRVEAAFDVLAQTVLTLS